ncbi:MAG: hypothetical protein AMJ90_03840 [candidate division Zixibacteria bacterium SM23_73_2]|nr:MAG: hypothetical protein AMJ90_03840 [candidate division Zixibacteria bacterium SM23_73_2]
MTKKLFILGILLLTSIPASGQSVGTAWVRIYNGSGDSYDGAYAIAVDDSGNVYVTGESNGIGTYSDYVTIKYYPNGDTAWVRTYNGLANGWDFAEDITVDDSGYVYVTGGSVGSSIYQDYATIKYYPNGDTVWVRRYYGQEDMWDQARAIAVDDSGYVYVTGTSWGGETYDDYATIKYYPNGDTVWVRRYDDPYNGGDQAEDITVDDSGYVYVTGTSCDSTHSDDCATIKYYPNGDTAWVRRYNGPGGAYDRARAIAVDDSGYVYITGHSWVDEEAQTDYITIKYYPNGDTVWVRRYNGPENDFDDAGAIAVDDSEYVYVTGYCSGGVPYDNYTTIKYYPNGDTVWIRSYYGPTDGTRPPSMVIDDSSYVYVTGHSCGNPTDGDYVTIKYNPDGDMAWVRNYNGPGDDWDGAHAIAVDDSGNVYVTGESFGSGTGYDYATIKYVQTDSCLLPGDVDNDGIVTGSGDIMDLIHYLYHCHPEPVCPLSGDVNGNCEVDFADAIGMCYWWFGSPYFDTLFPYCSYPETFLDPGVRDTLRVDSVEAAPGDDFVIPLNIFNDESIVLNIPLTIEDTTRVVIDSIVYQGTRGEGKFFDNPNYICEGSSGFLIYSLFSLEGVDTLAPGTGISGYLWGHVKAGAEQGFVKIDTSFLEPNQHLRFFKYQPNLNSLIPEFVYGGVNVLSPHICGDVNDDGEVNLSDPICLSNYYFGKPCEITPWPSDVNCDELINLGDAIIISNVYFGKPGFELNCCE